jgi:hypothetical protein
MGGDQAAGGGEKWLRAALGDHRGSGGPRQWYRRREAQGARMDSKESGRAALTPVVLTNEEQRPGHLSK